MVSWRLPPSLALAQSLLPNLEQQVAYLQQQLIAAASGPVDNIYSRLGIVNGLFFPQGWGDLGIVNLKEDIKLMQTWPPPGMQVQWRKVDQGTRDGMPYKLYEGSFRTPCVNRIYDALPPESRVGRVQLLVPGDGAPHTAQPPACAIHLAATGDQGFGRRLRLAFPLLKQGVCSLVHESPYYGSRRPEAQKGSKLLRVSDLFALGWATIYESMNLLHWLTGEGYDEGGLCMTGLSMGGVHACMTSALYPADVATAALLAPRSAAIAYCDGALSAAMAWQPLLNDADEANNSVLHVINAAAQPVDVMREATYALAELELAWEAAAAPGGGVVVPTERPTGTAHDTRKPSPPTTSPATATTSVATTIPEAAPSASYPMESGRHQPAAPSHEPQEANAGVVEAVTQVAEWLRSGGLQADNGSVTTPHTNTPTNSAHVRRSPEPQPPHTTTDTHRHTHPHAAPSRHTQHAQQQGHGAQHAQQRGAHVPTRPPVPVTAADMGTPVGTSEDAVSSGLAQLRNNRIITRMVGGLSEITQLSESDKDMQRRKTLRRLKHVLETYTDITRFPVPRRPDAAKFVAAVQDEYVTVESVRQLSDYWPGSEMRLVTGGHITAFLMHQDKFREAIVDSIHRLKHRDTDTTATGRGQSS